MTPLVDAPPKKPTSRLTVGLLGSAAGILLTIVALGGAAQLWRPQLRQWLVGDALTRLAQIEQAQTELAGQVDQLVTHPVAPSAHDAPAGIEDRMTRLETSIEQMRRAIPPEGELLRLSERTEAAERSVRDLTQQQSWSQALLLTLGQLRDAVDRGDSYSAELAAARRQVQGDDAALLDVLKADAETGIPRRETLRRDFEPVVQSLLAQEDLARGHGLWATITSHVRQVIAIRRMDGMGNDAEAILSRAEKALDRNDWDQAIIEMHSLPGPFETTAAPWIHQAEQRIAADRALSRLAAQAATRIAQH